MKWTAPAVRARFDSIPGMGLESLQATYREVQLRRGPFLHCWQPETPAKASTNDTQ